MNDGRTSRRRFLSMSVGVSAMACNPLQASQSIVASNPIRPIFDSYVEILRQPDVIFAIQAGRSSLPLARNGDLWTCKEIALQTMDKTDLQELQIRLTAPKTPLTYVHLRWRKKQQPGLRCIGDAWERSYGDLEWQGIVPERVMPWYFLTYDGQAVHGYGVKTQPSGMCFWQLDEDGISLWIDIRNGGDSAKLGDRTLQLATVVTHRGQTGEGVQAVSRRLCTQMCETPRLPRSPIFGFNDWNYAYGSNTADGILRDADLLDSVKPKGLHLPTLVIDDGWQDRKRFPDMASLAGKIRKHGIVPGIWIRPLRAPKEATGASTLSNQRFAARSGRSDSAYDPTTSEGMENIRLSVRNAVDAGFQFIKHDFSTYDLLGRWGNEMGPAPTLDGWRFQDGSRTNAEVICELYRAIRSEAGESLIILGCNTVGHLAAGIFESQRIGDDTSGRAWERTRRMGVNSLAHRISQHRTLSHIDPDCVAFTQDVAWTETRQWLDVVTRTGTSLFVSPAPDSINDEAKAALRDAFAVAAQRGSGYPVDPFSSTTPLEWKFDEEVTRTYDWTGADGASPFST